MKPILKRFILMICFLFLGQGLGNAQTTKNCAVSVDMLLIGEVCVVGGLGIRSANYQQDLKLYRPGTGLRIVEFEFNNQLLPITIATTPTKLAWIDFQFFIDFSLVENISSDEIYAEETFDDGSVVPGDIFEAMTEEQITEFKSFGIIDSNLRIDPSWEMNADMSYQYIMFGFMLKAPWPYFFKPFLGAALSHESTNIDLSFRKNGTHLTFYKIQTSRQELIRIVGFDLFNFEDIFFDGDSLIVRATSLRYDIYSVEGTNGIKLDFYRDRVIWDFANYTVTF